MKIEINESDLGILCVCAIRYCQGRMTYMPSLVQDIVGTLLDHLSDKDIYAMLHDCEMQEQIGNFGSDIIDRPSWEKWKKKLMEEKERRNNADSN